MRITRSVLAGLAANALVAHAVARPDYANQTLWQSAARNPQTVRFTELAPGTTLTDQFAARGVLFGGDVTVTDGAFADNAGARGIDNIFAVSFTQPANAIALDYVGQLLMVLYSRNDMVHTAYLGFTSETRAFGGVVSPMSFDRVIISNRYQDDAQIDDMHWALVPGPSGLAFVGCAMLLAARRAR